MRSRMRLNVHIAEVATPTSTRRRPPRSINALDDTRSTWFEEEEGSVGDQGLRDLREQQVRERDQLNQLQAQLAELQAAVGAGTPVVSRTQHSHTTCAPTPTPKPVPRTDPSVAAWQSVEARLAAIQAAMDHKHRLRPISTCSRVGSIRNAIGCSSRRLLLPIWTARAPMTDAYRRRGARRLNHTGRL
eukprot:6208711-Pleurochrysis_carterae.AAC.2